MTHHINPLSLLNAVPGEASADILQGALPYARPEELPILSRALWETGQIGGMVAVVKRLHRLEASFLEEYGDFPPPEKLGRVVHILRESGDVRGILNALEMIERRPDTLLLEHLPALFMFDDESVGDRAAEVLQRVVQDRLGAGGAGICSTDDLLVLDEVLAEGLETHRRHRRDGVLLAAAIFAPRTNPRNNPRPNSRLHAILQQADHPATMALRQVGEQTDDQPVRQNMIRWLGVEPLGRAALRWLHQLETAEEYADFLSSGHLLATPGRRRLLRAADRRERCLPRIETLIALPETAQRLAPGLPRAFGLTDEERGRRLEEMIALPSPLARFRVVIEWAALRRQGRERALPRFLRDRHPAVRRLAARQVFRLRRGGEQRAEISSHLDRSPDPVLARWATMHGSRLDHDYFWSHLIDLRGEVRVARALFWLGEQREAFLERLDISLHATDSVLLRCAIGLTRRLRLGPEMEQRLLELTTDRDGRAASAAVAGLEQGRRPERLGMVRQAMRHRDRRVGANAVEVLARISRRGDTDCPFNLLRPWLHGLGSHRHHRIRANAVLALLRGGDPEGLQGLLSMLIDARPCHRLAGVWAARVGRVHFIMNSRERMVLEDVRNNIRTDSEAARRMRGEVSLNREDTPAEVVHV